MSKTINVRVTIQMDKPDNEIKSDYEWATDMCDQMNTAINEQFRGGNIQPQILTENIDDDEVSEQTPDYDPEWCASCSKDMEDNGIEYTADFYHDQESWYCKHCNQPV